MTIKKPRISHCKNTIKQHKLTAKKFSKLVLSIGISAVREKFNLSRGQFYFIKELLGASYPCQRNGVISAEWLRDQELKRKTQEILPKTIKEYHEFYYGNVSPAERKRRREGYVSMLRSYNK